MQIAEPFEFVHLLSFVLLAMYKYPTLSHSYSMLFSTRRYPGKE